MKRIIAFFAVLFLLVTPFSAYASYTKMSTDNINADNNRIFDVPVYMNSSKILTAATFTVKYNPSAVAFRKAGTTIPNAKVNYVDNNGTVKAVFLCSNGVKINKKSLIVSVKFKTLQAGRSDIVVSASDTVDLNAKNFTAPSSVKSTVTVGGKTERIKYNRRTAKRNSRSAKTDADSEEEEIGEPYVEGKDDSNDSNSGDDGNIPEINSTLNSGKISPVLIICVALLSVILTALVMYAVTKKKDNKTKAGNKDDKEK